MLRKGQAERKRDMEKGRAKNDDQTKRHIDNVIE